MKNSVLVWFFNTSLFRQDFSHREFDVFYKQAYLQNGEMRRKARTVPVLPRSPSESSYYVTLLSLPHSTNPARVSSCSRACCPLNSISYCRYKRGILLKMYVFLTKRSLTLVLNSLTYLCTANVFLVRVKYLQSWSCNGTLLPPIILAGWSADPLGLKCCLCVTLCCFQLLRVTHLCQHRTGSAQESQWNLKHSVVQKHWNPGAWFQILPGRCFLRSLHLVF